ncbi:MAG: histidine triad nucleotide-binding protein [Oligoflexia bacterium]|nr:histidine triad nucleotide-binding protein [Oligoflexia bacterium]
MTIFTKIINKEIPADIVYEDELCLAFKDIKPQAPVHILLIPKKEISSSQEITKEDQNLMGHLMVKIPEIAKQLNLSTYRLVVNTGEDAGQTVSHIHIHILGGRKLGWPPG